MVEMVGTSRPGGRTARTRELVHAAVRKILGEPSGAAPTIAEVAVRSGVNAATIYRRWGTVEALVLDVAVADVNQDSPLEATGDLEADLLSWGRQLVRSVSRPEGLGLFRAILAAAATPVPAGESHAHLQLLVQPRLDQFQRLLDASDTAELTPTDLVDLVLAPVYIAALFTPPDQTNHTTDIERLVDNLLAVLIHRRHASRRSRENEAGTIVGAGPVDLPRSARGAERRVWE